MRNPSRERGTPPAGRAIPPRPFGAKSSRMGRPGGTYGSFSDCPVRFRRPPVIDDVEIRVLDPPRRRYMFGKFMTLAVALTLACHVPAFADTGKKGGKEEATFGALKAP